MQELSVGDGFKFGCGFFLAAFITQFIVGVIVALVMAILSLLGVTLISLPDVFGQLLPLLALV